MLDEIKKITSTPRDWRNFGILMGVIAIIIAAVLTWKLHPHYPYVWMLGFALILLSFIQPALLKPVYFLWMTLAVILGWIMTRLLLSLLYFGVFTPIHLLAWISGKQFIERKWDKSQKTYWHYREKRTFEPKHYVRQF